MKKSNFALSALLGMALGCALALPAFAGDGRNGGEFSGNSIPLKIERGVAYKDLVKATYKCWYSKNSKTNSLLKTIFEIGFGLKLDSTVQYFNYKTDLQEDYNMQKVGIQGQLNNKCFILHYHPSGSPRYTEDGFENLMNFSYSQYECKNTKSMFVRLTSSELPGYRWKKYLHGLDYDELGNPVDNMIVQGLEIKLPKDYEKNRHLLSFENDSSHQPTKLKVDLTDYVNCLQTEVQNLNAK